MAADWPEAQIVRLDDIFPGWNGLQEASRHVHDNVLASATPRWQRWDWATSAFKEWHELDASRPIIVEGCGALSRGNRTLATFAVWVELGETERKHRAIEREPDFKDHWDEWARQEVAFISRESPEELADEIVDGHDVLASAPMLRGRVR
jgi:hypothetical protein